MLWIVLILLALLAFFIWLSVMILLASLIFAIAVAYCIALAVRGLASADHGRRLDRRNPWRLGGSRSASVVFRREWEARNRRPTTAGTKSVSRTT
jgi:hypothetical protein